MLQYSKGELVTGVGEMAQGLRACSGSVFPEDTSLVPNIFIRQFTTAPGCHPPTQLKKIIIIDSNTWLLFSPNESNK